MIININQNKLEELANRLSGKFSKMTKEDIKTFIEYEINDLYNKGLYSKYGNYYLYYREILKHTCITINDYDISI